ncbi:MAG: YajQ family cyclic di-GMP-binding protein [Sutterella sp.]|nr:YajQ family cyclic di-GMP-binding protein [Sutterella sp.]
MPSFDVEVKCDAVELRNAVDQAKKEIGTRYDFRGTAASVDQKDLELYLIAESDFQLRQVRDVLIAKLAKRGIDVRFLDESKNPEKIGGDKLKQTIVVKEGVSRELGKTVQTIIKNAKALKLTAAIQGDIVRVSGAKRDALQEAIALLKKEVKDVPLSFTNFRA